MTRPNYWGDTIALNNHTKIKSLSYKLKLFAGVHDANTLGDEKGKWVELTSLSATNNIQFVDSCYFELIDLNNSNYSIAKIYLSDIVFSDEIIDTTLNTTLNTYISSHSNAVISIKYWNDNAGTAPYTVGNEFAFVEVIDSQIATDDANFDIKTKYRYITAQLFINFEIYNYTMYDVLDILLKQNRLTSQNYDSKRHTLFDLPTDNPSDAQEKALYDLLTTTYPQDTLSFTQATFYDALTEIFRYYDAGFKFDYNQKLQIEYYNNPESKVTPSLVGKQMSHNDKNFNNGRVAYYQNALLSVKIPRITVRSQSFGVPNESDFGILVEKPFYNIDKLYVDVWTTSKFTPVESDEGFNFDRMKLDITTFVLNDSEYTALDKASPNGYTGGADLTHKYQVGTLHFARGGDFISLSETFSNALDQTKYNFNNVLKNATARYFGIGILITSGFQSGAAPFPHPVANDYSEQVFSIEYTTMNNGRSQVETPINKYNGQQIVNQNDGLLDLNKLGLNILGESLKDGEPTLTANTIITNWNKRIKEGDYIEYQDAYWVANVVNYTELTNNKFRCSVEFTKNFNALSLRVRSDKEKRLTNVSSENAVLSEDNYIDYVYITKSSLINNYTYEETILNHDVLASMIALTFKADDLNTVTYNDIRFGMVTTYDLLDNVNTYGTVASGDLPKAENRYIPILKYGLGNCVCFEMQFKDSLSAGNQLTISSGWFGTNKYFSSAALYTDDEGWADKITINFCDLTPEGEINDIGNYPVVDNTKVSLGTDKYVQIVSSINKLEYYKKPNEIFALNYEWCFLVAESLKNDLFIGNKFINENFFTNKEIIKNKTFYLKYVPSSNTTFKEKYSILDTKGIGTNVVALTGINLVFVNNKIKLGFKVPSSITAKIWAIVDENNDIYFAGNFVTTFNNFSLDNSYQLAFITTRTRKDY